MRQLRHKSFLSRRVLSFLSYVRFTTSHWTLIEVSSNSTLLILLSGVLYMPRYSKRVIAINELSEAVVSNCIYSSATKLLLEESDEDYDSDEEDELLCGRVTVATYYAVCNMSRYLF